MKKLLLLSISALIAVSLTGCCTDKTVSKPSQITLVNAMKSIGQGFAEMKTAEGDTRTGLYPDSATVTFNISAGSSNAHGLTVDLDASAGPQIPVSGSLGGSLSNSFTAQRGNQITITFKNIFNLTPSNSLAAKPEDIQKILNIIKDAHNESTLMVPIPKPTAP